MHEDLKFNMDKGIKYDQEKPRMDLLDPSFTIGVAEVLTFGAKKYAADNWRGGIEVTRIIASIHRHLAEIQKGNDFDEESKLPHVYHIACNCQFLGWMLENKPEMDDRWKPSEETIQQMFARENNDEFK